MSLDDTQVLDTSLNDETDDENSANCIEDLVASLVVKDLSNKGDDLFFYIHSGINKIGRGPDCEICIGSKFISKYHCSIEYINGTHLVYDGQSKNGTKKNKILLLPDVRYELKNGDILELGKIRCEYFFIIKTSGSSTNIYKDVKSSVDDKNIENGLQFEYINDQEEDDCDNKSFSSRDLLADKGNEAALKEFSIIDSSNKEDLIRNKDMDKLKPEFTGENTEYRGPLLEFCTLPVVVDTFDIFAKFPKKLLKEETTDVPNKSSLPHVKSPKDGNCEIFNIAAETQDIVEAPRRVVVPNNGSINITEVPDTPEKDQLESFTVIAQRPNHSYHRNDESSEWNDEKLNKKRLYIDHKNKCKSDGNGFMALGKACLEVEQNMQAVYCIANEAYKQSQKNGKYSFSQHLDYPFCENSNERNNLIDETRLNKNMIKNDARSMTFGQNKSGDQNLEYFINNGEGHIGVEEQKLSLEVHKKPSGKGDHITDETGSLDELLIKQQLNAVLPCEVIVHAANVFSKPYTKECAILKEPVDDIVTKCSYEHQDNKQFTESHNKMLPNSIVSLRLLKKRRNIRRKLFGFISDDYELNCKAKPFGSFDQRYEEYDSEEASKARDLPNSVTESLSNCLIKEKLNIKKGLKLKTFKDRPGSVLGDLYGTGLRDDISSLEKCFHRCVDVQGVRNVVGIKNSSHDFTDFLSLTKASPDVSEIEKFNMDFQPSLDGIKLSQSNVMDENHGCKNERESEVKLKHVICDDIEIFKESKKLAKPNEVGFFSNNNMETYVPVIKKYKIEFYKHSPKRQIESDLMHSKSLDKMKESLKIRRKNKQKLDDGDQVELSNVSEKNKVTLNVTDKPYSECLEVCKKSLVENGYDTYPIQKTRIENQEKTNVRRRKNAKDEKINIFPLKENGKIDGVLIENKSTFPPNKDISDILKKPRIMFTGVRDNDIMKTITKLGGDEAKSVTECTHIISDQVRRTIKFMCGVARGIPIVSIEWLRECKKQNKFVDAWQYLIKDETSEVRFGFCLEKSLCQASSQKLFGKLFFYITKNVKPAKSELKEIILCAGGRVLDAMPKKFSADLIVITCAEDSKLWKSLNILGIPIVSVEFVMTGILRHNVDVQEFHISNAIGREEKDNVLQ